MDTKNVWIGSVLSGILLILFSLGIALNRSTNPSEFLGYILLLIVAIAGTFNLTRGLMLRNSTKK